MRRSEIKKRASDLGKMIDGFGAVGPRYWQGKFARKESEKWIRDIIINIRSQKISPAKNTAAYTIAWYLDENKRQLSTQIASVELLNIIKNPYDKMP